MAHDLAIVVIKALLGGTIVVIFTGIGHILRPRWFAGLFGAAPSVAIASLTVTVVDKGHQAAGLAAWGMVFGALGFIAFAACVRPLLVIVPAVVASAFGCGIWAVVAVGTYLAAIHL
jgi:hypothetical protein